MKKLALYPLLCLCLLCTLLQGCAVVAVGAGSMAVAAANDRRTVGTQLDDQTAQSRIAFALSEVESLKKTTNISVDVYNGIALLTGQTPTEAMRSAAEKAARSVAHVRKVHNQIRIGAPIPATVQANDLWLGSKVRTLLLTDKRVNAMHIEVIVQDSEVFLMGLMNNQEAAMAVDVVRNINGVARVVKAFEIR